MVNLWRDAGHVAKYLGQADTIPHRMEGEAVLLELLPEGCLRALDLGTGDGRLASLVRAERPDCEVVAVDFSPAMLERARERFASDRAVEVLEHDLEQPLPDLGRFDIVVSSFAIHHLADDRKRTLYAEVHGVLNPGGLFANLEHVASPTPALHAQWLRAMGRTPDDDDPSNKLVAVEVQLEWLREAGFRDVDCFWKWRELALLAGWRP